MRDMPRRVKDVIVLILANPLLELSFLDVRKRCASVFVHVRFTYTTPKGKKIRVNVAKQTKIDMLKVAKDAKKLMEHHMGPSRDKPDYVTAAGTVLSVLIGKVKLDERARRTVELDNNHRGATTTIHLGNTENVKTH